MSTGAHSGKPDLAANSHPRTANTSTRGRGTLHFRTVSSYCLLGRATARLARALRMARSHPRTRLPIMYTSSLSPCFPRLTLTHPRRRAHPSPVHPPHPLRSSALQAHKTRHARRIRHRIRGHARQRRHDAARVQHLRHAPPRALRRAPHRGPPLRLPSPVLFSRRRLFPFDFRTRDTRSSTAGPAAAHGAAAHATREHRALEPGPDTRRTPCGCVRKPECVPVERRVGPRALCLSVPVSAVRGRRGGCGVRGGASAEVRDARRAMGARREGHGAAGR